MDYKTAEIRQFLNETFNDTELTALCADYFPEVEDEFTAGMTKSQKIQILIDYAKRRDKVSHLFAAVEKTRPTQYAKRFPAIPTRKTTPETVAPETGLGQVFVSHATREDGVFAQRLGADLRARGWRVWIAPQSILPGEKWAEAIEQGLTDSRYFVLVLTPAGIKNKWVRREADMAIQLADAERLRFIQILAKPCDQIPLRWDSFQRVTTFLESYDVGLDDLLSALKGHPSPKVPSPQLPHRPERESGTARPEESIELPHKKRYVDSGAVRSHNRFLIVCGGAGIELLGQRNVLGMNGELHIDVSSEIDSSVSANDHASLSVRLDQVQSAGTASHLLIEMEVRVEKETPSGAYKRHTKFLEDNWTVSISLRDALATSPAIGGLAIRHPENVARLDSVLRKMINELAWNLGPTNPIEFWIVSSTAGGTGEGTHRFVAERIAHILERQMGVRVELNFVRIGPLTYSAVSPERTRINSFFGIAADAAFKTKLQQNYPHVAMTSNWFYLEVPPVGVGSAAKPTRAKLIEMACKAIMLDEVQESIHTLVVNDGVALVRVGYWERDFDESAMYFETLRQLIAKLTDLISPNGYAKYVAFKPEAIFDSGDSMIKINSALGRSMALLETGGLKWEFPQYGSPEVSAQPEDLVKLVNQWKRAIDQLVYPERLDDVKPRFLIRQRVKKPHGEESEMQDAPLTVPSRDVTQEFGTVWFEKIEAAQQVRAWASALLEGEQDKKGLKAKLHDLARSCSNAQHPTFPQSLSLSRRHKAENLRKYLWDFTETLIKVDLLLTLMRDAESLLNPALVRAREILAFAEREYTVLETRAHGIEKVPVIAADLSERVDNRDRNWLQLLNDAVQRRDLQFFQREVLKGAIGLTRSGLSSILNLREDADVQQIRETLREKVGRMIDPITFTEFEAVWWQSTPPAGIQREYRFRILPRLDPATRTELGEGDENLLYLSAQTGNLGLRVIALEACTIGEFHDTTWSPTYLISPFIRSVKELLKDWNSANQLRVVSAGVGGEPLLKPALLKSGLTDNELDKLAEFYDLYDPFEGTKKN